MSYATPEVKNMAAAWSLGLGLMFCLFPVVPGVAAIVMGRRGLRIARQHAAGRAKMATAGIVLGVINLVLSAIFFASIPVAARNARRAAQTVACLSNLRQLGLATVIYANGSKGFLPPTIDHVAGVMPGAVGGRVFACPACAGNAAKPPVTIGTTVSSNYYFVMPATRISGIRQANRTVIAYEPPSNHDNHLINLLFADGHAASVSGPLMTKVAAELAAGQNPPPSMK
jgi:prepilin-type processing-associated H-X9-DG protein